LRAGPRGATRPRPALAAVLALAALVRLLHWLAVRDEPFVAALVLDSREYDGWATAIAAGDWLGGEPFFQAPLYPYLLAIVYATFGRSLDTVYLLQIALAVAGCWALYRAGRVLAGEPIGLLAAALAATYPAFVVHDVLVAKESIAVVLTCFLLWALAAARARGAPRPWLAAGLLLGLLGLLRENLLLTLPFLLPLAWAAPPDGRPAGAGAAGWRGAAAFLGGVALVLLPVAARNAAVGGGFLPTTFQGGVNLWIGNNPEADGTYRPLVPGRQTPALERAESVRLAEAALGRPLAPAEVSRYWRRRALAWARDEPGAFLRLQARKLRLFASWYEWPDAVDLYWLRARSPILRLPWPEFGGVTLLAAAGLLVLALRRDLGRFAPALLWGAGAAATAVVFFVFARYRLPVVPALLLLAAVPLAAGVAAARARRWAPAAAWASLLALALAAPRLAGHGPRLDLVHANLGRLAQEAGRTAEAAAHYRAALAVEPGDLQSWMGLGGLAARDGRWREAAAAYERAAALAPEADDALASLGAARLALGDLAGAEAALEAALAHNPRSTLALHDLAVLHARRGDRAAALDYNRRLLAVDPRHPQGLVLRDRLATPDAAPPERPPR
jgi:tetratricopeptide (TPR) repeat protein